MLAMALEALGARDDGASWGAPLAPNETATTGDAPAGAGDTLVIDGAGERATGRSPTRTCGMARGSSSGIDVTVSAVSQPPLSTSGAEPGRDGGPTPGDVCIGPRASSATVGAEGDGATAGERGD